MTRRFEARGGNYTIAELAAMINISPSTMHGRIRRSPGVPVDALMFPSTHVGRRVPSRIHEYRGTLYTIKELAAMGGTSISTMRQRVKRYGTEVALAKGSKEPIKYNIADVTITLPDNAEDYELRQRIGSYQRMGMSEEEMLRRELLRDKI